MTRLAAVLLFLSAVAWSQTQTQTKTQTQASRTVPGVLEKGASEWGAFVGGGTGFGKRSGTQFAFVGGRWGRVLTAEHGPGWLRGNFEYKIAVFPFVAFLQPPVNSYGVEFKPVNLAWNFRGNRRVKPYVELGGGLLLTTHDIPVNTNNVNFSPQGGAGFHFFTAARRAITLETFYKHVSNAGLERRNAGINAALQLTLGYTWFH